MWKRRVDRLSGRLDLTACAFIPFFYFILSTRNYNFLYSMYVCMLTMSHMNLNQGWGSLSLNTGSKQEVDQNYNVFY